MTTTLAPLQLDPPIATFLAHHGLSAANLKPLPSDASLRSYIRLQGADQLLMEDRTDPIGFAAFIRLPRHLNTLGLSAPCVLGCDSALVLRDFHIDNLMLLKDRNGIKSCGLLDFQDAVIGATEYDLVSLLQDTRRDLTPELETQILNRYLASASGSAVETKHRYHLLGAQRHTRLARQFLRLNKRDDKPGYLQFIPRVLQQMQTALKAADLTEIEDFIDTSLPSWRNVGSVLSQNT